MHPRDRRFDEPLEKQGRRDRARESALGSVGDIGGLAFDHLAVGGPQRQPPQRIEGGLAGGEQRVGDAVVVAEKRGQLGAERDARGAGQGGEIGDQSRTPAGRLGERVGQYHPSLGVGVADLDGQALARPHDIERAHGVARDAVFHRRDQHAEPHVEFRRHHHVGEAERVRRAAHVLFHQLHIGGRFQIESAGIEADALADQRHARRPGPAPNQVDQSRRASGRRRAADRVHGRIAFFEQGVADDLGHARAVAAGERARGGGQIGRTHVVGRNIDEIAHQVGRLGGARDRSAIGGLRPDENGAVRFLPAVAAIAVERVGRERPAERQGIGGGGPDVVFQAIGAGRKPARKARIPPWPRIIGLDERHAGDASVGTGHGQHGAGFGPEMIGARPALEPSRRRFQPPGERLGRDPNDGHRVARAVDERQGRGQQRVRRGHEHPDDLKSGGPGRIL